MLPLRLDEPPAPPDEAYRPPHGFGGRQALAGCRIAIVHDQLYICGGAERVLEQLIACFPHADVFALFDVVPSDQRTFLRNKRVTTTSMQRLPRLRHWHRHYFMLMPLMIEQLDLGGYDIVLSSSYLVAKGVIVGPDQLHISYVHSPMRHAWDLQGEQLKQMKLKRGFGSLMVRLGLHYMRLWDSRTSGVDLFIANSRFIARRIRKSYDRDAEIVYPPVDLDRHTVRFAEDERDGYFLTVSRLVPHKRVDIVVDAFARMPDQRLVVIGGGPQLKTIARTAGRNVKVLGEQPDAVVSAYMQRAAGFIHAAREDFGIAPVEAQACGTPVIAFARGGAFETVRPLVHPDPTGVLFEEQTADSVVAAVRHFLDARHRFTVESCRTNATRFTTARFREAIIDIVASEYDKHRKPQGPAPGRR